ncbi:MAG TPA: hypothetical protein VKP68_16695 [Ramlibacter sp.]|nr:hypothetical protein [Ramlibacter sp.]
MSDATDKLAQTRLAIIAHIQRSERRSNGRAARHERDGVGADSDTDAEAGWEQDLEAPPHGRVRAWYQRIQRAGSAWWRHHPAHAGLELATPVLSSFAARRPVSYLGIAALTGAVIVVARPWRLVSVTGLLVALVKSSQLSGMVLAAMAAADYGTDDQPS